MRDFITLVCSTFLEKWIHKKTFSEKEEAVIAGFRDNLSFLFIDEASF